MHPTRKAAPAIAPATCSPGTNASRRFTSAPSSATPSTPPTWRPALSTAEAIPACSDGAASMTAAVIAGMVKDMPNPMAISSAQRAM